MWALLWTSFEFSQISHGEDKNIDTTRSSAAQLIAHRVLRSMSSQDVIRALTMDFDLPSTHPTSDNVDDSATSDDLHDTSRPLLSDNPGNGRNQTSDPEAARPRPSGGGPSVSMSALEVAIAGEALKFIASPIVQDLLQDIWKGNVVLWGDLDVNASTARKKATIYAWRRTMWAGYARLRVPRYRFAFQVVNFAVLLVLFLSTLRQPDRDHLSVQEIFLDIWFLGFAYSELGMYSSLFARDIGLMSVGQIRDSNLSMYSQDPWSFFDVAMVLIFGVFFS
jgi:hypothetical protein